MERKFRVWCVNKNEWEQNECFLSENGDIYQFERGILTPMRKETHLPSYYTGLKDKNGVEIYEGDIVKYRTDKYYSNTDYIEAVEYSMYYAGFLPFAEYDSDCDIYVEKETVEVIGNIYQNPELLK